MSEKQPGVASVERALSILGAFKPQDEGLSLHELSLRTGLHKSTILRLAATLENAHCLHRLADGRYQLGSMLFHWGGVYQASLRLEDHVVPMLKKLVEQTGEGASFFTRDGDVRVCLFRVDSPRSIRDHVHQGDLMELDRGAAGRVLLSFDPSITAPADFPPTPVILSKGEREPDIAAVAGPVFGPGPSLRGALAISGPCIRFSPEVMEKISALVVSASYELTRRLGGDTTLIPNVPDAR